MSSEMDGIWDRVNAVSDKTFAGWREVSLLYWAISLAGEVGEFCNLVKKLEEGGPRAQGITKEGLVEELVDVYIYLQKTVESLGTSREGFAREVLAKLAEVESRKRLADA